MLTSPRSQPQGTEKQPSRSIKIQKMKKKKSKIQNPEEKKKSLDLYSGTSGTQRSKRRKDLPRLHSFLAETTKRGEQDEISGFLLLLTETEDHSEGIQRGGKKRSENKPFFFFFFFFGRESLKPDRKVEGKGRKSTVAGGSLVSL